MSQLQTVRLMRIGAMMQGGIAAYFIYDGVRDESVFWIVFGGVAAMIGVIVAIQAETS
jgi:hypothetical protein